MERRRVARETAYISTVVRVFGPDRYFEGWIVDFSPEGLGLVMSEPLAVNTAFVVEHEGVLLLAEVCNCRRTENAYRIGARIPQGLATKRASMPLEDVVARLAAHFA